MSDLRIRKVKVIPKQEKIKIEYMKGEDTLSGVYSEPARPELYEAIEKLVGPVCSICELPTDTFASRIEPYGVTFSYMNEGTTMKASVQATLHMPASDTDTVLNTPSRTVSTEYEDGLDDVTCRLLYTVEEEARKYLKGGRAQQSLFGEEINATPQAAQIEG